MTTVLRRASGWLGIAILAGLPAWAAEVNVSEERMKRDITFLASEVCEGRGPGTEGINKAADFIAAAFKESGLKGAGKDGSYFQPFQMRGQAKLTKGTGITITAPKGEPHKLTLGDDFQPLGLTGTGKAKGDLVFAGYSVVAPDIQYDDYAGINVEGKIVLIIRKTPRFGDKDKPFDGDNARKHAALTSKLEHAEGHKAAAVLMVNDIDEAGEDDDLMPFGATASGTPAKIPAFHIKRKVAEPIIEAVTGLTLKQLEASIDKDLKPRSAELKGYGAELEVGVDRGNMEVKNVVGVLEGSGPHADETIVIGAHYDHLGYGGPRSGSLDPKAKSIHFGADDNGSGTTALIEMSRRLGAIQKDRQGRRILLIAFSGEEAGLLGSAHYVKDPIYPLAKTAAMINMDMVGRLPTDEKADSLTIYGTGSAKGFDEIVEKYNAKYQFKLKKIATGMGPSDHQSFYMKGVPVLFYFTGLHKDYHKPSDTPDKINFAGMKKIVDMVEETAVELAGGTTMPEYVKVAGGGANAAGPGSGSGRSGPRLGIMPNYEDEADGVLLSGVSPGGAAEKAGLKEGDRILEIEGKPVKNVTAYMTLMATFKKGDVLKVSYTRGGKKLTAELTPQ